MTEIENIQKYIEQSSEKIWDDGKKHLKEYGFNDETSDFLVAVVVARLFLNRRYLE